MKGPGYDIWVPWSVRFTWSGDYMHDAFWSVGEQGFTNVSHGCVNLSPANAETYYKLAVPGDPVTITGSPRGGPGATAGRCGSSPGANWCAAAPCIRRCGPARPGAHSSTRGTFLDPGPSRRARPRGQATPSQPEPLVASPGAVAPGRAGRSAGRGSWRSWSAARAGLPARPCPAARGSHSPGVARSPVARAAWSGPRA